MYQFVEKAYNVTQCRRIKFQIYILGEWQIQHGFVYTCKAERSAAEY